MNKKTGDLMRRRKTINEARLGIYRIATTIYIEFWRAVDLLIFMAEHKKLKEKNVDEVTLFLIFYFLRKSFFTDHVFTCKRCQGGEKNRKEKSQWRYGRGRGSTLYIPTLSIHFKNHIKNVLLPQNFCFEPCLPGAHF